MHFSCHGDLQAIWSQFWSEFIGASFSNILQELLEIREIGPLRQHFQSVS